MKGHVGLGLAKHVFQIHGIDAAEKVVVRKPLRRSQMMAFCEALPPCLVGMEACATAHYWARELTKLSHEVAPDAGAKDVKAYVERNKNYAERSSLLTRRRSDRGRDFAAGLDLYRDKFDWRQTQAWADLQTRRSLLA
jgi:transposase